MVVHIPDTAGIYFCLERSEYKLTGNITPKFKKTSCSTQLIMNF